MGVLARELDSYKRAVDQYNRSLRGYNKQVKAYNDTIVMDANGNAVVSDASGNTYTVDREGRLGGFTPPNGQTLADYGRAVIPGENRFQLLRQNPTERRVETATGVVRVGGDEGNAPRYEIPNNEGAGQVLGPEWRQVSAQGSASEGGTPTYTFERDASVYMDRPEAFGKTAPKQPNPSMAQVRRMFTGSLASQERGGLINDVIRGNGLATGVQFRSGAATPKANQQQQPGGTTPIDPDFEPPTLNRGNQYNQMR